MNRIHSTTAIPTDFILDSDEAQAELHQRGWSIGHTAFDGVHQVSGNKQGIWIVAEASTELASWLLVCEKANEVERVWKSRN